MGLRYFGTAAALLAGFRLGVLCCVGLTITKVIVLVNNLGYLFCNIAGSYRASAQKKTAREGGGEGRGRPRHVKCSQDAAGELSSILAIQLIIKELFISYVLCATGKCLT